MIDAFRVPVILTYHSVEDYAGGRRIYGNAITPEKFDRHIEFITSHYRVVTLSEFVDAMTCRIRTDGMACITLDDGYVDNLTITREVLKKYRASATAFIPTGFVGRKYFWWDALHAAFSATPVSPEVIHREVLAQFPDLGLQHAAQADWSVSVWDRLRRGPLDEAYRMVEEFAARLGVPLDGLVRPVQLKELRDLSRWPFEIGSHAISHRPLPALSIDEARAEIRDSRAFLQDHTGSTVGAFSYPFGLFDIEVAQSCRNAGYSCAVSLATDYRVFYRDTFGLTRIDGSDGDVDDLVSILGKYEERNLQSFAVHKAVAPMPTAANSGRCSGFSSASAATTASPNIGDYDLFRTTPVNRDWGYYRGKPLDRPLIEQFIDTHAGDLHGRILEIKEPEYASQYARPGSKIDILDVDPANTSADIIDDLQACSKIADDTYDCLILTQVLQLIPDVDRAIATAARILRPGGVLLVTACGITQTVATNEGEFYWSFFRPGLKRAISRHFDVKRLLVESHGNVGLAASFLMGLTTADVPTNLFAFNDPEYPVIVTARAVKPAPVPTKLDWPRTAENPDITVIIPMFNAERTIKETLFSVSQQSHSSFEVLVIDDGSTDNSRKLVEEIAGDSNGHVTVLAHARNVNRGLSHTRNLGIEHARGEYLVFLDADDTIHPEKFAHNLGILRSHPEAAAVIGRTLYWWDDSSGHDAHLDTVFEPANRVVYPPEYFNATYHNATNGEPTCVHSWMVRKSVIGKIEPFDPDALTYEDQKFLAELSLRFPIYVASACLCDYRRNEGTLWATAMVSGVDAVARSWFLDWKEGILKTLRTIPGS